jgi:hypothetical protein
MQILAPTVKDSLGIGVTEAVEANHGEGDDKEADTDAQE